MMTWFDMLIIPPFERIIDLEKVEEISLNKLNKDIDDEKIKFVLFSSMKKAPFKLKLLYNIWIL